MQPVLIVSFSCVVEVPSRMKVEGCCWCKHVSKHPNSLDHLCNPISQSHLWTIVTCFPNCFARSTSKCASGCRGPRETLLGRGSERHSVLCEAFRSRSTTVSGHHSILANCLDMFGLSFRNKDIGHIVLWLYNFPCPGASAGISGMFHGNFGRCTKRTTTISEL